MTVEVAGDPSTVKLTHTVKVSLRTRDGNEARLRHASVQAQLQERWAAARKGAVSLSHKDIMALAGVWYRDLVMTHQDEPGDADNWEVYQDLLGEGLAYFDPDGDGIEQEAYDPRRGVSVLSQHFNIDDFLSARGLKLDQPSRTKLIEYVAAAPVQGAETLKRRAHGDYAPDEVAKRFQFGSQNGRASL